MEWSHQPLISPVMASYRGVDRALGWRIAAQQADAWKKQQLPDPYMAEEDSSTEYMAEALRDMVNLVGISTLITFYIPQDFIVDILKGIGAFSVIVDTLAGIPAYTTNITALPLISGLLSLGMNPGAALAFLIAGPVTTLPAMVAIWGIASRKVFLLYLSFSMMGLTLIFPLSYPGFHPGLLSHRR